LGIKLQNEARLELWRDHRRTSEHVPRKPCPNFIKLKSRR